MRLRNIKGARNVIKDTSFCIKEPENYKGRWNEEIFHNNNPIHVEIGMGKGKFIMELAMKNPDINYVGIEKYSSVLLRGIQKMNAMEEPLSNLVFIRFDAEHITEIFGQEEIDKIYLNFSDPWPKDRHAKRRLPSARFLEKFHRILVKDGEIEFKTDNRVLFDFALDEVEAGGFELVRHTFDLHNDSEMMEGNIMTEYEERFSSIGNP